MSDFSRLNNLPLLPRSCHLLLLAALLAAGLFLTLPVSAKTLPAFAFRQVTLSVVQADGSPVPNASVYGFCRDLNLVWPRPTSDSQWANISVWHPSFLGQTGEDGSVTAKIPAGNWSFFAAASLPGDSPAALVVWSDFRQPLAGENIRLAPATQKAWTFCAPNGAPAAPRQLFFKPASLPIWIPIGAAPSTQPWQIQLSAGNLGVWGAADATATRPGLILSWGNLTGSMPDGKLLPSGPVATLAFKGGQGRSSLSWLAWSNFGLEGQIVLAQNATVLISAGNFSLGCTRPLAGSLTATFVSEFYSLKATGHPVFNLDSPLTATLDQALPAAPARGEDVDDVDTTKNANLFAQLYLIDGDGHLVSEIDDASGRPARFSATVSVNGVRSDAKTLADNTTLDDGSQFLFAAPLESNSSPANTTWEISGPVGVLPPSPLTPAKPILVKSATFAINVPPLLQPHAENILVEAEIVAQAMNQASGRLRKKGPTVLHASAGHHGASASHNGTSISIGTKLLFSNSLILRHDFDHELGHNYGFTHGGLHETSNEVTRSTGAAQVSQQSAKWMFIDRMNGITHPEVGYHNTGLYLYCYAQGGEPFLRFISLNEYPVIAKLAKDYTKDEVETALLGLALHRDLTAICQAYGLKVTPDRVAQATTAAQSLCQTPKP